MGFTFPFSVLSSLPRTLFGDCYAFFDAKPLPPLDNHSRQASWPKMTGDELSRQVLSIRPDIPIVMCTGFSERIDQGTAKNVGIRELLTKPLARKDVADITRKVLDNVR